jgi:hypothetical protein
MAGVDDARGDGAAVHGDDAAAIRRRQRFHDAA